MLLRTYILNIFYDIAEMLKHFIYLNNNVRYLFL